jgi:PEP-CTERM motif
MFGHLFRVSFNSQTDILSGVFAGKEQMVAFVGGKWAPVYWYQVQGMFSENLGSGVGSLNLTSEKFIGSSPTAVPEPETLTMLGTGLCAIAGVVMRKLRRLPRGCD